MLLSLKISLLGILCIYTFFCEAKGENSTIISRREILEQQARTAYQNACYRLQELSNWMTAVFRIKSVWASATVNEIASRSDGSMTETGRRKKVGLPSRPKAASSECSLSSVQVTAQTYAYLQSQLVMMKWLLGRNIFKTSKERLGGAKERMRILETFNTTLNDVVSKLKQNTVNATIPPDSEAWRSRNIIRDAPDSSFLQLLQNPKTLLMNMLDDQVTNNRAHNPNEPRSFFQNLGRNLDKLIFPTAPINLNTNAENSVVNVEQTAPEAEHSVTSTDHSVPQDEHSAANVHYSVPKEEHSAAKPERPVTKLSTNNAVMLSSIL